MAFALNALVRFAREIDEHGRGLPIQAALHGLLCILIIKLGPSGIRSFIYFQSLF